MSSTERAAPSTSIIRIRRAPFPLWYPPAATASSGTIPAIGRAELTTVMTRWVAQVSRQMDYVVISGPTPRRIS